MTWQKILELTKNAYHELSSKERFRHGILFLLTFISTTITAMGMSGGENFFAYLSDGLFFSVPLMTILAAHEMGHYLNARAYGVEATPPFFIPMPIISPIGTMGAFIRMKGIVPDNRALFDIAFWGPAMSFILSVPVFVAGMAMSHLETIPQGADYFIFGDSIFTWLVGKIMFNPPAGSEVIIHPMGFAGWTGLLVTAINLLPVGQLDGGHIAYAVIGKRQKQLAYVLIFFMAILAFKYSGWMLWILIFLIMGFRHPPMENSYSSQAPLDDNRKKLGMLAFIVFLLTFVPAPISAPEDFASPNFDAPSQESPVFDSDDEWNVKYPTPSETKNKTNLNFIKNIETNNTQHKSKI